MAKQKELPITVKLIITGTDRSVDEYELIKHKNLAGSVKALEEKGYIMPFHVDNLIIPDTEQKSLFYLRTAKGDTPLSLNNAGHDVESIIEGLIANTQLPFSKSTDKDIHVTYVMVDRSNAYSVASAFNKCGYHARSIFPMGRRD